MLDGVFLIAAVSRMECDSQRRAGVEKRERNPQRAEGRGQ